MACDSVATGRRAHGDDDILIEGELFAADRTRGKDHGARLRVEVGQDAGGNSGGYFRCAKAFGGPCHCNVRVLAVA